MEGQDKSIRWRSDFNMGQADMERLHKIKEVLDQYSFLINKFDEESVLYLDGYYSSLQTLYFNLQTIMDKTRKSEFDTIFKMAEKKIAISYKSSRGGQLNVSGHKALGRLHQYLLKHMQESGLGLPVSRKVKAEHKLKSLLQGTVGK